MCCCGKPTVNGEPGYSWDGKTFHVRPVNPPPLTDGDALLFDGPGRCGNGIDSHCHHFRLVKSLTGYYYLLVLHGGGEERINLHFCRHVAVNIILSVSDNEAYWLLHMIYYVHNHAEHDTRMDTNNMWKLAVVEKRVKKRTRRGKKEVWIEPKSRREAKNTNAITPSPAEPERKENTPPAPMPPARRIVVQN